jgi:hypothetical protein
MMHVEPLTEYFIKTRKGKGKEYAKQIFRCLEKRSCEGDGWVQAREFVNFFVKNQKIPQLTLFRILNDMISFKILEKIERIVPSSRSRADKKKKSVFYRLYPSIAILSHYSEEEQDHALKKWQLQLLELHIDHTIALKLIEKNNLTHEYERMKEHDEYKKKFENAVRSLKEQL